MVFLPSVFMSNPFLLFFMMWFGGLHNWFSIWSHWVLRYLPLWRGRDQWDGKYCLFGHLRFPHQYITQFWELFINVLHTLFLTKLCIKWEGKLQLVVTTYYLLPSIWFRARRSCLELKIYLIKNTKICSAKQKPLGGSADQKLVWKFVLNWKLKNFRSAGSNNWWTDYQSWTMK